MRAADSPDRIGDRPIYVGFVIRLGQLAKKRSPRNFWGSSLCGKLNLGRVFLSVVPCRIPVGNGTVR